MSTIYQITYYSKLEHSEFVIRINIKKGYFIVNSFYNKISEKLYYIWLNAWGIHNHEFRRENYNKEKTELLLFDHNYISSLPVKTKIKTLDFNSLILSIYSNYIKQNIYIVSILKI